MGEWQTYNEIAARAAHDDGDDMHDTLRDIARELAERYRAAEGVEAREGYRQALRHVRRVREELRFAENAEAEE